MILIVDDDRDYAQDLLEVLKSEGFGEIAVANTGQQALGALEAGVHPEAIVLDLMLPYDGDDLDGMDPPRPHSVARGVELLRMFIERGYAPSKVLVITALYSEEHLRAVTDLGVQSVLTKPVLTETVFGELRRILAEGEAGDLGSGHSP